MVSFKIISSAITAFTWLHTLKNDYTDDAE